MDKVILKPATTIPLPSICPLSPSGSFYNFLMSLFQVIFTEFVIKRKKNQLNLFHSLSPPLSPSSLHILIFTHHHHHLYHHHHSCFECLTELTDLPDFITVTQQFIKDHCGADGGDDDTGNKQENGTIHRVKKIAGDDDDDDDDVSKYDDKNGDMSRRGDGEENLKKASKLNSSDKGKKGTKKEKKKEEGKKMEDEGDGKKGLGMDGKANKGVSNEELRECKVRCCFQVFH